MERTVSSELATRATFSIWNRQKRSGDWLKANLESLREFLSLTRTSSAREFQSPEVIYATFQGELTGTDRVIDELTQTFANYSESFLSSSTVCSLIYYTVIDHLHSERLAFVTCSLVCKTWLPVSQYHLFQTNIRLTESNIHSFVELSFFRRELNV